MRLVRIGLWTLVAAAVLPAGTVLAATQEREGFWIGFGAGYGSANVWTSSSEGETLDFGTVTGTVTFYPWASSGFFVKGGAGLSLVSADVLKDGKLITVDLGDGFGAVAGMGYDLRIRRNLSLTPVCNFYLGWPGDLRVGVETVARNWRFNVVEISLGLTFH